MINHPKGLEENAFEEIYLQNLSIISQGCRFVPYTFSETIRHRMVPMDPLYIFGYNPVSYFQVLDVLGSIGVLGIFLDELLPRFWGLHTS